MDARVLGPLSYVFTLYTIRRKNASAFNFLPIALEFTTFLPYNIVLYTGATRLNICGYSSVVRAHPCQG